MRYDLSFDRHMALGLALLCLLQPVVTSAEKLATGRAIAGLTDARNTIKPYRSCREMKQVTGTLDAAIDKLAKNERLIKMLTAKPNDKRLAKTLRSNLSGAQADLRNASKYLQRIKRLPASCNPAGAQSRLGAKRKELQDAIDEAAIDSAKANYKDVKEQQKRAIRIIQDNIELQTQVIQKVTS